MFRRLESSLPNDPVFPADLKELGYFVNDQDEIRSIENPKAYYGYFVSKNERVNDLRREGMNEVVRNIVAGRLEKLGMEKIRLPLGAKPTDRHIPIFVSSDIRKKKKVLILFGEQNQDLGVLSYRTTGGKGGINEGSVINLVKCIQSMHSSTSDDESPAIILANLGQLRWWRRGKKAVSQTTWYALPSKSLVDPCYEFDSELNTVPGNRNQAQHIEYVLNHVVKELTLPDAKLDIIGVAGGGVEVCVFLEKQENWSNLKSRLSAIALLADFYSPSDSENDEFKSWLANRGRAYIVSNEPCGIPLAGPEGSDNIAPLGCPVFSLGVPYYPENLLVRGYKVVIDWLQEVHSDSNYINPKFVTIPG